MTANTELVGLSGAGGRWRPVAAGPFALLAVALALLPIRPVWLWALLIAAVSALPWALGAAPEARRRPRPYWRLSSAGLERIGKGGGPAMVRYERERIDGLAITTGDGMLTVFHRFGRTAVGGLTAMGLEPLALFVTARRLGIPMHVLDGEASDLLDPALDEALRHQGPDGDVPGPGFSAPGPLPRDHAAEKRLLDQEAALLAAVHEPPRPKDGAGPAAERAEFRLDTPDPLPGRRRVALLGTLTGMLGAVMIVRIAVQGAGGFEARLAAGCWALAAITGGLAARRRLLRAARVRWTITAERLLVRARPGRRQLQDLPSGKVAAVVVGPGLRLDPLSGEPRRAELAALAFGHRLELVARLPAHGLDGFQLAHALDDHGYHVITPGARPPRRPEYGLEGLPDIFAQVPGGRLVVADGGLGWADAAGDVVLKMPEDRIGGIELLTIAGHAWVRLYDGDGDEFFAAPLSALRISRTDLRESARKAGLPVNDAEYDAYLSAAFHSAMSTLTAPEPETRATAPLAAPGAAADGSERSEGSEGPEGAEGAEDVRDASRAPGGFPGEPDFAFTAPEPPSPVTAPGALLDATRRSRVGTYGMSVLLCEAVALIGAVWLGPDLGGFGATASWSVPAGLLIGLAGYWLYDRNRSQLRVTSAGLAVVTRRGRVEWDLARDRIGGVGIDESTERLPRLVVWGPSGRVLRQVTFPPDLDELRRACERYGVPWGPPDADRPAPPPPEL